MKRLLVFLGFFLLCLVIGSTFVPINEEHVRNEDFLSTKIVDRNGVLLREVLSNAAGAGQWVDLNTISPWVEKAFIAAEDQRFYQHVGIDFLATLRAMWSNLKKGRVVSGASTLTQQLARIVYGYPRTWLAKPAVVHAALRIENCMEKRDIIEAYVNRVCYGNQLFGIDAAARTYFSKSPTRLSPAESAFLAGLVKAPTRLNPYRNLEAAQKRKGYVLRRMFRNGDLTSTLYQAALAEKIHLQQFNRTFKAPHFCQFVIDSIGKQYPGRHFSVIRTTIDYQLQRELEKIISARVNALKDRNVTNGALIVLQNDGDILAMVGSKDFHDDSIDGQVNGALTRRQPGSTIKPFTYGLALEAGMKASDVIPDVSFRELGIGSNIMIRNYDLSFHGPVRLRTALACSYNVPAVRVLKMVGEEKLLNRLKIAGFGSLNMPSEYYRLGLTLGDGDVTLLELVRAYAALARGGAYRNERAVLSLEDHNGNRIDVPASFDGPTVFTPQICALITNILSDNYARSPSFGSHSMIHFPFACATKTGTSTRCRDNWTIGYTPDFTVGVWTGNFNATPMKGVSGVDGAGSIYRDAFMAMASRYKMHQKFVLPEGLIECEICPVSGYKPGPNCPHSMNELFLKGREPKEECKVHDKPHDNLTPVKETHFQEYLQWTKENMIPQPAQLASSAVPIGRISIVFPADGDVFEIEPSAGIQTQHIKIKAIIPEDTKSIVWLTDGKQFRRANDSPHFWWKLTSGNHRFQAVANFSDGNTVSSNEVHIMVH